MFLLTAWLLYLGVRYVGTLPLLWIPLGLAVLSIAWLPLSYWQLDEPEDTTFHRLMLWISYGSMGWLSVLFAFAVGRDLIAAGFWISGQPAPFLYGNWPNLVLGCAAAVVASLGFRSARLPPAVKEVKVKVNDLHPSLEGFRIAQISDLHVGSTLGVDLMLCGHTHGGQFFPWTLLVGLFHPVVHGLHRLHGMWVYVSRGTGYWGPPLRIGAPSEITLLTLERE